MKLLTAISPAAPRAPWRGHPRHSSFVIRHSHPAPRLAPRASCPAQRGFTMIEIAICLAIIGVALVGIIGVLPYGMNTQRDNREETVIGQDANFLTELIRNGARGADDLTNYIYAITNYWSFTDYVAKTYQTGTCGYSYASSSTPPNFIYTPSYPINSGSNIVGILSTPEFTDAKGVAIRKLDPAFVTSGYSNHIVAYVRSINGLAAEKPPQDNQIMRDDTFKYRLFIVNAPMEFDSPLLWVPQNYLVGAQVSYYLNGGATYWQANVAVTSGDTPGVSAKWTRYAYFNHEVAGVQRELRLSFLWPQLPNGNVGAGRQVFRSSVSGQIGAYICNGPAGGQLLHFYQAQSFTRTP